MARLNTTITITAGTPINVAVALSAQAKVPVKSANRIFVQLDIGGTGNGSVLSGVPVLDTPSATNAAHLTARLAPATSTAPGGSYADVNPQADIDLTKFWIDGSHTGDPVIVSAETRQV